MYREGCGSSTKNLRPIDRKIVELIWKQEQVSSARLGIRKITKTKRVTWYHEKALDGERTFQLVNRFFLVCLEDVRRASQPWSSTWIIFVIQHLPATRENILLIYNISLLKGFELGFYFRDRQFRLLGSTRHIRLLCLHQRRVHRAK